MIRPGPGSERFLTDWEGGVFGYSIYPFRTAIAVGLTLLVIQPMGSMALLAEAA